MKSWFSTIVWLGCHPGLPHFPSIKPPWSREVQFDRVVKLLGLRGPINPTCDQYNSKLAHRGQNNAVLNRHRRGLQPWNLRIAMTRSPPFPSKCSTFPYLPCRVTQTNMNIDLYPTYIYNNLLVYKAEALHASGTYHSTSTMSNNTKHSTSSR
jgi:hypothetical protein